MPNKVIAFVSVEAGRESAFMEAARTCAEASRAEAGVLYYDVWREVGGAGRFAFNELYADDAAGRDDLVWRGVYDDGRFDRHARGCVRKVMRMARANESWGNLRPYQ